MHWVYPSDLERGRQPPDMVNRLARALGVTLAEFFAPLNHPYRLRFRKARRDVGRDRGVDVAAPNTHFSRRRCPVIRA